MIKEEDILEFERIINLSHASPGDKMAMSNICAKYNMRGCNICATCDEQVRKLHKKIIDYYNKNK